MFKFMPDGVRVHAAIGELNLLIRTRASLTPSIDAIFRRLVTLPVD